MTFKASLFYAIKIIFSKKSNNVSSRGRKTLIGATFCIGISLVPLIAILVISNGMINGITSRMINLFSYDLNFRLNHNLEVVKSYESFIEASEHIKIVEDVLEVYPEVRSTALACGKDFRTGATVRAINPDVFEKNKDFNSLFTVIDGTSKLTGLREAIIGDKLSEILSLKIGDSIKIVTIDASDKNRIRPKVSIFKIVGIVSSGYQELDSLWVFVPLKSAFSSFAKSSLEYFIGIKTDDSFSPKLSEIERKLYTYVNVFYDTFNVQITNWTQENASQYESFTSTKSLLFLVMLLVLLVASINISSALVMIVMERKREIAILKSCGASSKGIRLSFLLVGFSCGFFGVLFGLPLGLFISININEIFTFIEKFINFIIRTYALIVHGSDFVSEYFYILNPEFYLQKIPIEIPFMELFLICMFTILLSLVMAFIPSMRAGKEKPINILQKV